MKTAYRGNNINEIKVIKRCKIKNLNRLAKYRKITWKSNYYLLIFTYGRKFEPKQAGIQGLEGLVKSDEEVAQSYTTETSTPHFDGKVQDKDI